MKNKGFTLIELLAVIIILGILMLIAIPSVTNYINNSRKNTYVTTVNELVKGTIAKVNSGELNMYDTDTTYYVPCTCIKLENGEAKSPYGKFDPAYVVVTFDGSNYHYYFTGKDVQNMGVPTLTSADILSKESIVANVEAIDTSVGIEGTSNVYVFSDECNGEGETNPVGTTVPGEIPSGTEVETHNIVCKKAKTLHTAKCNRTNGDGCYTAVGSWNTITYGTIPNGAPKRGNAYDCDVNDDDVYDPVTERFYYVTSDGDESTLIYYTNMNGQTTYRHCFYRANYLGPDESYEVLPDTSTWSNPGLITSQTRNIVNELGTNTTKNGYYTIQEFTYTDRAARFLTLQEVQEGCPSIFNFEDFSNHELDNCNYFLENIGWYENDGGNWKYGYWLETPLSSDDRTVWIVYGYQRTVARLEVEFAGYVGVRPAITVLTSDIEK